MSCCAIAFRVPSLIVFCRTWKRDGNNAAIRKAIAAAPNIVAVVEGISFQRNSDLTLPKHMSGLIKAKKINISDTNIAGLGTELEKEVQARICNGR
jgi:hypothetical protein